MDLKKMEYFIAAAEEGTFTKAAARCYISQTAISQQIASIENELDIELFDRSKYRPRLTPAGKRFYASCRQILKFYEDAIADVKQLALRKQKKLSIGVTGAFERFLLTDLLHPYVRLYPDVMITIHEHKINECVQQLEDGQLDVLLVPANDLGSNVRLEVTQFTSQGVCVLTSEDHPFAKKNKVSPEELKDQKFIVLSKSVNSNSYQAFIDACEKDGFTPNIVQEVESPYDLILLVGLGKGIAVTSKQVPLEQGMVQSVNLVGSSHQSEYCLARYKHNNAKEITDFIQVASKECEN